MDLELLDEEKRQVWEKINNMMDVGYGCAESFVVAVGDYLWDGVDDQIQMISTGFSGGVGGTHEEVCGGVSGAAVILGMLYGRTTNDESKMIRCKRLIATHRDRFVDEFGTTTCQELRDAQFGADERNPCSAMIAPAAFMLLDILEEEREREAMAAAQQASLDQADVLPLDDYQKARTEDDSRTLLTQIKRAELPHGHRAWVGDRLAELGDPRDGVGLDANGLPCIAWLPVEAGRVEVERAGAFEAEPFYIAKYPVTFQQFQAFVDDPHGFRDARWWDGLPAADEHRAEPGTQRFVGSNSPRENVSWFDAVAFCRWLTARLHDNAPADEVGERLARDSWVIRLPTEWEWQLAATGGDPGNKFPWGLEWQDTCAHTKHDQLNRTMAVGMYPRGASPVGALDMSGNVWEWCLNTYEDPANLDFGRTDRRVLRGGSWYHWGSYAHTDMRSRYYPDHRYNAGGFRVVCGVGEV